MCNYIYNASVNESISRIFPQVFGREALEKTTLKSLGLSSGKAILRLIYRDHEQLKTQAHVSTPLLPKTVAIMDDSPSDKDQRPPFIHCNKTTNDINLASVSKTENQEKPEGEEVKIGERVNTFSNEKQERDISKIEESHFITSNHEDRDTETDQRIAKVEENAYEIKFVRCKCAYVQSYSHDRFTYRGFHVTVRREKRSSIQSSRSSSIAEG